MSKKYELIALKKAESQTDYISKLVSALGEAAKRLNVVENYSRYKWSLGLNEFGVDEFVDDLNNEAAYSQNDRLHDERQARLTAKVTKEKK